MPERKGERFSLKPKYFIGISVVVTNFLLLSRIYHTTNMPKNTIRFEPRSIEYQNFHPAVGGVAAGGFGGAGAFDEEAAGARAALGEEVFGDGGGAAAGESAAAAFGAVGGGLAGYHDVAIGVGGEGPAKGIEAGMVFGFDAGGSQGEEEGAGFLKDEADAFGGGAHGYSGGVAESAAQASGIPRAIEGSGAPVMHFLLIAELPGGAFGGQQKKLELFAFEMRTAGFHIPVDDLGGAAAHQADGDAHGVFDGDAGDSAALGAGAAEVGVGDGEFAAVGALEGAADAEEMHFPGLSGPGVSGG